MIDIFQPGEEWTMDTICLSPAYANISQRAAVSFLRLLAAPSSAAGEIIELHAFFKSLYSSLYQHPEQFGLPLGADLFIDENEPNPKDKKQEVKRRLDKPRGMIVAGLDFLRLAGTQGRLEGQALLLDGYTTALKQTKVNKAFLCGLGSLGLTLSVSGDTARLHSDRCPHLPNALQAFARCCAAFRDAEMGRFQFARCDERALRQASPDPVEVYRVFNDQDYGLVMQLHEFFIQKGYKVAFEGNGFLAWIAKYQGNRKVKATPLFEINFDDRYARPLRLQIKCASTQRIAGLLPQQSQLLRDDFSRRVNFCRGDECGWCRNSKILGPTVMEINGEPRTVCWYTNPDIHELNQETVELVREYEQMHMQLV
jgi:hypothetical protein